MLTKTKAIILHHIKYGESSVIAYCYTLDYGRLSLIVQGVRKKNAKTRLNLLQPLQINEIDFYYKEKHGLLRLKEIRSFHRADELLFDTAKSAVALFLAELFYKTLKEEVKNTEQFQFIEDSISNLCRLEKGYPAFYLKFLLDYSMLLGFYPNTDNLKGARYFDLMNGVFLSHLPNHEFNIEGEPMQTLIKLLETENEQISEIIISNTQRDGLLNALLDYYMLHMEGVTSLKSLQVLRELFHG